MRDVILLACLRAVVILVPSYTAAWLSGEMTWTIPRPSCGFNEAAARCRGKPARKEAARFRGLMLQ